MISIRTENDDQKPVLDKDVGEGILQTYGVLVKMPPKKKPLEDARKRLQEKLSNVQEQSDFICQFINDLANKASSPAKELLKEKDRKRFFQKYSSVSQELEKCLDCLLLISDSVTAFEEEDILGTGEDIGSSASESSDHPDHEPAASKDSSLEAKSVQTSDDTSKDKQTVPVASGSVPKTEKEKQTAKLKESEHEKEESILKRVHQQQWDKDGHEELRRNAKEGVTVPDKLQPSVSQSSLPISDATEPEQKYAIATQATQPSLVSNLQKSQSEQTQLGGAGLNDLSKPSQQSPSLSITSEASKSGEGLNLISSLVDAESAKAPSTQTLSEDALASRSRKNSKRRGSCSSTSTLSDIIQDIKISPREAMVAAGSMSTEVQLASYPFKNGQQLNVIVTEVLSPWEFWIQPVGTQLDMLMEEMCMHYAKLASAGYKGGLSLPPSIGDFCCAKFTQDDTWYRVLVTAIEESDKGPIVAVLSVDDGNREKLDLSRLRPLEEKFAKLPCQALCCALSGVRPVNPSQPNAPVAKLSIWSEESIAWLKSRVSGVKLTAFPTRVKVGKLVIVDLFVSPPKNRNARSSVSSQSESEGLPQLQYSIAEMMIHIGLAQRIAPSVPDKDSSSRSASSSPLSAASCDSLPRSVSSVSIESSVHDGAVAIGQNCDALNEKCEKKWTDESANTDTSTCSTSSRDTVLHRTVHVAKKAADDSLEVQDKSMQEKGNSEDDYIKKESPLEQGTDDCSGSEPNLEGENHDKSIDDNDIVRNDVTVLTELQPVSGPEESFITELPPMDGPVCLQMLMSHVVSPSEFYVHLVTPDAGLLDVMMDELNKFYDGDPFPDSCAPRNGYKPKVGEYCCARFSEDGRWYRGLVTSSRHTVDEKKGPVSALWDVRVFHVDFGSSEWVSVKDVKPLVTKFLSQPRQVVKCRLANLKPERLEGYSQTTEQNPSPQTSSEVKVVSSAEEKGRQSQEEKPSSSFVEPSSKTEPSSSSKSRKRDRRKRKRPPKINLKDEIIRAAGDESYDSSELSELEFFKSREEERRGVKPKEKDVSSDKSNKSAFPEKYLLPSPDVSPDKPFPLPVPTQTPAVDDDQWASGAAELLSGLTDENRKLVGYMVPWDPWVYQQLFNPSAGGAMVDITYRNPVLNLDLFDTTGDEDIFVNQVLIDTGIAVFSENSQLQTVTDIIKMKVSQEDLENTALSMEQKGSSPEEPINIDGFVSPTSPTSPLHGWDPMKEDFLSSKNTYAVNPDDLDIAFQGYQDLSRRVCRYFRTRSGCWRGDQCPNLHVKKGEDLHEMVEVFCDNMDSSVTLPDIGTWVAVRVTAVFNPGHFWVQFPYGTEPIEKSIMAARTRHRLNSDSEDEQEKPEEDLNTLMDKMGKFYSRNVCQDPRRILPAAGELCAAKYSKDNKWYRARITSVREDELQVFFVDYGNSEWTRESHVKRMLPHFLHLPFQALECFLGNVEPAYNHQKNGKKLDWSEDAMKTFSSLTEDKTLIAHVLSKAWNQTVYVDLWDTEGDEEIHINKVLIENGFAHETDHTVSNPWNIEASFEVNPHKTVGLPG